MREPDWMARSHVWVFLKNSVHWHERWMMRFLQKRGWVVFYLEERDRICAPDCCWLKLYQDGNK